MSARHRRDRCDRGVEPGTPPVGRVPVVASTHGHQGANHTTTVLRNLDLLLLAIALPAFILVDAPLVGYLAAGGAWLVGRVWIEYAARRRASALAAGNRNAALGVTAVATMGRVWLIAGAILLVGLLAEREAGLAAAVLALVLVTSSLAASFAAHLVDPDADPTLR